MYMICKIRTKDEKFPEMRDFARDNDAEENKQVDDRLAHNKSEDENPHLRRRGILKPWENPGHKHAPGNDQ